MPPEMEGLNHDTCACRHKLKSLVRCLLHIAAVLPPVKLLHLSAVLGHVPVSVTCVIYLGASASGVNLLSSFTASLSSLWCFVWQDEICAAGLE